MWIPFISKKKPIDNQEHAPDRQSRKQCWEKRDEFFSCLDKINILNSLDPNNSKIIKSNCSREKSEFEHNCATSWISYFQEKRIAEYKRSLVMKESEESLKKK
ncbi:hypothetical protein ACO0SA_003430 [Hanseniaspora valbyensis]